MSDIFERIDAEIDSALNEKFENPFKKQTYKSPVYDDDGKITGANYERLNKFQERKWRKRTDAASKAAAQRRLEVSKQSKTLDPNYQPTNESYSDAELLGFLEENNFETSYSNLCILKEGLANGTIILEAKQAEEAPEEKVPEEEAQVEEEPVAEEPPTEE